MPYLIDGHNLIPKMGLKLADLDDELQLIEILQKYCREQQTTAEVYFDGASPGQASQTKAGRVKAHFVRKGGTADEAIEMRLGKLGQNARNWSVVSSDRRVKASAREVHARVITSDEFARRVNESGNSPGSPEKTETTLSPQAVDEWMQVFKDPKKEL